MSLVELKSVSSTFSIRHSLLGAISMVTGLFSMILAESAVSPFMRTIPLSGSYEQAAHSIVFQSASISRMFLNTFHSEWLR
ncbi:hypothetical protein Barb6XT_01217 [Bacteroidales bacterium Barb6XT]|nr:hypothetical protein Barb6XT_01217 [Bacteroidales bacterium Barb6XT]